MALLIILLFSCRPWVIESLTVPTVRDTAVDSTPRDPSSRFFLTTLIFGTNVSSILGCAKTSPSLFCLFGHPIFISQPRFATATCGGWFSVIRVSASTGFSSESLYWFGPFPWHTALNAVVGRLGRVILCRYSQWLVMAAREFSLLALPIFISP